MQSKENQYYKIILIIIGVIVLLLGIFEFFYPGGVFPDPAWGFSVLRSMQNGGGFNQLIRPNPENISKNLSDFLTWWSPGQYLVPYTFIKLFQLNLGQASAITITLCQFIGLAGFFSLFRKLGFTPIVSAVSLSFIVCQQFFTLPYLFYNGGEVLAFAFSGWFLYGCTAFQRAGWQLVLFAFVSGLIAFFCKSSVMWLYVAGLLFLWIRLSLNKPVATWITNAIWTGIPAALSVAVIYFSFISKGQTPVSDSLGFKFSLAAISFPLASPLLSGFSVDDLFNGIIFHNDTPILNPSWSLIVLIAVAVLSIAVVYIIVRYINNNTYRQLIVILYCVSVIFYTYIFLKQLNVSLEARHMRVMGLIIIPSVLYLVSKIQFPYKMLFGLLWIGIAYSSLHILYSGLKYNSMQGVRGSSDIVQQAIDQPSLNYVMNLDKQHKDAIFVFISNDTGLDITQNRVLTLDPIGPDVRIDYDDYAHYGHAGPVFILLPRSYTGAKANIILKCFPGYKGFTLKDLTRDYVLYSAYQAR